LIIVFFLLPPLADVIPDEVFSAEVFGDIPDLVEVSTSVSRYDPSASVLLCLSSSCELSKPSVNCVPPPLEESK